MRQSNLIAQNQSFVVIPNYEAYEMLVNQIDEYNASQNTREAQQIQIPLFETKREYKNLNNPSQLNIFSTSQSYIKFNPYQYRNLENQYEIQLADMVFLKEYNQNNNEHISEEEFELIIQYKELEKHYDKFVAFKSGDGIDPGRNFQHQWELLQLHVWANKQIPIEIINYYNQKVEKLGRPLLRVFMRAIQNDPRTHIAFRPSRVYKQRRLKRLGLSISEFESLQKHLKTENQIGLQAMKIIQYREWVKYDIIQNQRSLYLQKLNEYSHQDDNIYDHDIDMVDENYQLKTQNIIIKDIEAQSNLLTKRFKECTLDDAKQKLDSIADQLKNNNKVEQQNIVQSNWTKYNECEIDDCQFNPFSKLDKTYLTNELVEVMDEQYFSMRQKGFQIDWPEIPLTLRQNINLNDDVIDQQESVLVISQSEILGLYMIGQQIIIGDLNRVTIIQRQEENELRQNENSNESKSQKKRNGIKISLIDPQSRRMSSAQGLKVEYDHFLSHKIKYQDISSQLIESQRKQYQKTRTDKHRREKQLKLKIQKKKQREEMLKKHRSLLTVRLKWEDLVVRQDIQDREEITTKQGYQKADKQIQMEISKDRDFKQRQVNRDKMSIEKNKYHKDEIENHNQKQSISNTIQQEIKVIYQELQIPKNISAITQKNKIILRKQDDPLKLQQQQQQSQQQQLQKQESEIALHYTETSPRRFKLVLKTDSNSTLKLGHESYESCSFNTMKNGFQLSNSKIDEFKQIIE